MAMTYQNFASLGVNLNRQKYGPLDISAVFISEADLKYYITKGTFTEGVSEYWYKNENEKIVPYPYEGQIISTAIDGKVKTYVLALDDGGNFKLKSIGSATGSEGLEFKTFGNGKCSVAIGECTDAYITIPYKSSDGDLVTAIAANGFANNSSLEEVILPNSIQTIGENAFANCSILKEVNIPNNVQDISATAFNNCSKLSQITIPSSVKSIGANAFANSSLLIYCENAIKPAGWDSSWAGDNTIIWNFATDFYQAHQRTALLNTNGHFPSWNAAERAAKEAKILTDKSAAYHHGQLACVNGGEFARYYIMQPDGNISNILLESDLMMQFIASDDNADEGMLVLGLYPNHTYENFIWNTFTGDGSSEGIAQTTAIWNNFTGSGNDVILASSAIWQDF